MLNNLSKVPHVGNSSLIAEFVLLTLLNGLRLPAGRSQLTPIDKGENRLNYNGQT